MKEKENKEKKKRKKRIKFREMWKKGTLSNEESEH